MCFSAAEMEEQVIETAEKEGCITEQTQYFFVNKEVSFRGSVDCENCSR